MSYYFKKRCLFYCGNNRITTNTMNKKKMQIPYYKRNAVKNGMLFNEEIVSANCSMTSPHQLKYLSMTGTKDHPGDHHPILFSSDSWYIRLVQK